MNALPPFCDARVLHAPNHLGQPGTDISVFLAGRLACAPSHPGGEDDRVSGTDADRRENISRSGSSWFGGNTDSAEMADLARVRVLINAQIAARFYARTLRLPHLWYWYFWLTLVKNLHYGRGSSVGRMLLTAAVVRDRGNLLPRLKSGNCSGLRN